MYVQRQTVSITTAADGTATVKSDVIIGRVLAIHYVKPGSGSFDDGVDFTIIADATGEGLWTESNVNASKSVYPRAPVQDQVGADATLDGTRKMREPIALANDRVKIAIAQGGNVKTGSFIIVTG